MLVGVFLDTVPAVQLQSHLHLSYSGQICRWMTEDNECIINVALISLDIGHVCSNWTPHVYTESDHGIDPHYYHSVPHLQLLNYPAIVLQYDGWMDSMTVIYY